MSACGVVGAVVAGMDAGPDSALLFICRLAAPFALSSECSPRSDFIAMRRTNACLPNYMIIGDSSRSWHIILLLCLPLGWVIVVVVVVFGGGRRTCCHDRAPLSICPARHTHVGAHCSLLSHRVVQAKGLGSHKAVV